MMTLERFMKICVRSRPYAPTTMGNPNEESGGRKLDDAAFAGAPNDKDESIAPLERHALGNKLAAKPSDVGIT